MVIKMKESSLVYLSEESKKLISLVKLEVKPLT